MLNPGLPFRPKNVRGFFGAGGESKTGTGYPRFMTNTKKTHDDQPSQPGETMEDPNEVTERNRREREEKEREQIEEAIRLGK